jgi:hypothetical protein
MRQPQISLQHSNSSGRNAGNPTCLTQSGRANAVQLLLNLTRDTRYACVRKCLGYLSGLSIADTSNVTVLLPDVSAILRLSLDCRKYTRRRSLAQN